MNIPLMIAVVAVFWTAEHPPLPIEDAGLRLALVAAGVAFLSSAAWVLSWLVCRQLPHCPETRSVTLRWYRRARTAHLLLVLALFAGALYGLAWPQWVRVNCGLERTVLLDELLILAPLLVPLAISWAAFYEVDRTMRRLVARASGKSPPLRSRLEYVGQHFRHCLGLVLVPVLLVSATIDLLSYAVSNSTAEAAGAMLALAATLLGFPLLLRLLWKAKPLPPGPLRERLEKIGRRAGFRTRDILVWDTGGTVANAAVAGFFAPVRYVMLSDGLVEHFSHAEVEAVFGHEIGHIKHRHVPLRLAYLLPLCGLLALAPEGFFADGRQWSGWLPLAACQLAVMAAYLVVVFGYFSRRLERQADVFACRVNSCGRLNCSEHAAPSDAVQEELPALLCPASISTFTRMLEKLAEFNGLSRKAPSWQHFSIARRIHFLDSLVANPSAELHFHRSLQRTNVALALTVAVVFACVGLTMLV